MFRGEVIKPCFVVTMKQITYYLSFVVFVSLQVVLFMSPAHIHAQGTDWSKVSAACADPNKPAGIKCFEAVFENLVTALVSLAGLALFVMLLIGGYKYLMSSGDPEKTASARSTMFYAIVGIVVMISTFLILRIVAWFTGVDVLKFEIPTF